MHVWHCAAQLFLWECSVVKLLMGKSKFKEKNRGKQGGGSKGRSFQVLAFNIQANTNSVA